ncbi:zinc finger protein JACKDAW-like [Rutidosis leptorrhynchoides]|uniref:zinc finger protein JACKDAW-like n=1 Tax=Rutidosis leptorrhynchoides TaxID=125765 RepID=UPI003A9A0F69
MMSGDGFSSPPSSLTTYIHEPITNPNPNPNSSASGKRKRNQAGNPDPEAEVIALSPTSLMATNRFLCEICNKGFQRDQNLQLHRRGHNLPWKLKQRNKNEVIKKKVYICPEKSCVHHDPSRALGDLTGVKKHYSRKHGEKKWKCEKCSKKYAVQSDWKAHSKICGTREYKCDCGTLFSRKDSFITHRAFCDALMEDNSRMTSLPVGPNMANLGFRNDLIMMNGGGSDSQFQGVFGGLESNLDVNGAKSRLPIWLENNGNNPPLENPNNSTFLGSSSSNYNGGMLPPDMMNWMSRYNGLPQGLLKEEDENQKEMQLNSMYDNYGGSTTPNNLVCSTLQPHPPQAVVNMSATALLQKAAQMGSTRSSNSNVPGGNDTSGFGLMSSTTLSNLSSPRNGDRFMMMMGDGPTQSKGTGGNEIGDGDLTRDFLGVARNERGVSFSLQQELSKFTSSTMGFNQFNGNQE